MRKIIVCFAGLVLALGVAAMADDTKPPDATQGMEGMPPMGPSEEIKKITPEMIGDWDCVMKMKMTPADTGWMVANGTCKWEAILDGCILQQSFDMPMMGMPFKGLGWLGYNADAKEWRQSWADNAGGVITYYTGKKVGEKMIFEGKDLMQGKMYHMRMTSTTVKPGTVLWTMEISEDGKDYWTSMEATYTKK